MFGRLDEFYDPDTKSKVPDAQIEPVVRKYLASRWNLRDLTNSRTVAEMTNEVVRRFMDAYFNDPFYINNEIGDITVDEMVNNLFPGSQKKAAKIDIASPTQYPVKQFDWKTITDIVNTGVKGYTEFQKQQLLNELAQAQMQNKPAYLPTEVVNQWSESKTVGVTIGVVAAVAAGLGLIWWFSRKRSKPSKSTPLAPRPSSAKVFLSSPSKMKMLPGSGTTALAKI